MGVDLMREDDPGAQAVRRAEDPPAPVDLETGIARIRRTYRCGRAAAEGVMV
ncbi:hypothetical protein [Streptomyces sp. B6B3]|uniref:hypothetical protein n=1 Tax=Streptomyces sp. B6B3 TaxID=3153570 RepID=UPI00325F343E